MGAAGQDQSVAVDVYQRLLKERIIFIGSAIDQNTANTVCAQLILLEAEDPERDISLYINSPGGSVTDARRRARDCSSQETPLTTNRSRRVTPDDLRRFPKHPCV